MEGGYVRVSSARQRDQSDSLSSQRQRLAAAGCTRFYEDVVSGYRLDQRRKAADFRRLQDDIRSGMLTVLRVVRLDRAARRDEIVLELADICAAHGVTFLSLASGAIDTSTATGWLGVKVQLMLAEHFSRQLSESIRGGYRGLHAQGIPARSAASLPFHLARDPGTRHGVIPSPEWSHARRAVEMVIAGHTLPQVAGFLADAVGHHGDPKTVTTWLRAPSIAGHMARRDGQILIRDCWPALVTAEEWMQIGDALDRRRRGAVAQAGDRTPRALSGICTCGLCGGTMAYDVARRPGGAYSYLRCGRFGCRRPGIRVELVELLIVEQLPPLIEGLAHQVAAAEGATVLPAEAAGWQHELRARERIPAEYRQDADRQRIADLRAMITAAARRPETDPQRLVEIEMALRDVPGWFRRAEADRNRLLRMAVGGVTVSPGPVVRVTARGSA